MKTLVCLLSGQPIPNIVSVHHLRPDCLVLVETEQAKKGNLLENLLQSLKERDLDFTDSSKHESVFVENQNSFPDICETLRKIAKKHQDDDVYVNLTGGTKPMSMAALESFRTTKKTTFIYIAENEDQVVKEFLTYSVIPPAIGKHQFTVKEFALAYGFEFQKSIVKIQEAEKIATSRWETARVIAKHVNVSEGISFGDHDNYGVITLLRKAKPFHDLQPGQVSIHSEDIRHALTEFDPNIRFEGHVMLGRVESSLGEFLTGGWLEEFIWGLLTKKAEQLGFHDIRLGVVLSLRNKSMNNDLDVAFMDGTHFTTIECKSGLQNHTTPQEILYKLSQVSSQQGALHAQSLLVATSEQFFNKGGLKEGLKDRAAHYRIKLILRDEITELANNPDDVDFIKKTFAR